MNIVNYFKLNGKTALIAGGATGLGYQMAKGLLSLGCDVTIISRNNNNLKKAEKELNNHNFNSKCNSMVCDISDNSSIDKMISKISSKYNNKLNIAINSAGFNIRNKIEDVSIEEWEAIQKVNSTGGFLFAKAVYPILKNASFGRLINVASIFSTVSYSERVSYASSKGSLLLLTKTLAVEWADSNITVNSISPGPFLTDINKPVLDDPENYKNFCLNIPKGRFGNPNEIITACLFLASPYSSYVNGSDIVVDGGWLSS